MSTVSYEPQWSNIELSWSKTSRTWDDTSLIYHYEVGFDETLGLSLGNGIVIGKGISEGLSIKATENDTQKQKKVFAESMVITDEVSRSVWRTTESSFSISGSELRRIGKGVSEDLSIVTTEQDTNIQNRTINETLSVSDTVTRVVTKGVGEQLGIEDDFLRNSNAVISDIAVSVTSIPTERPIGYTEWQPFVSGDYTYKNALLKCAISAVDDTSTVIMPKYCVYVDLPDIQDHAITHIRTAERLWVPFNLEFYRAPEVSITTYGGTEVVIPRIVEVTDKGFYVELVNLENKLSTGVISWTALGC